MKQTIWACARFLLLTTILLGGVYTLLVTGAGQLLFSNQANGSQIEKDGRVIGSELIGQEFSDAGYFSGRPQAVSQLSPVSGEQKQLVAGRTEGELAENPGETLVPVDLVTASASGVDPDISLEAAEFQISRISEARKISKEEINVIIRENTKTELFSTRKYINVLQLNLALDSLEQ